MAGLAFPLAAPLGGDVSNIPYKVLQFVSTVPPVFDTRPIATSVTFAIAYVIGLSDDIIGGKSEAT